MSREETFSIKKTIRSNPPISGLLCLKMKEKVLGKDYNLSLVFVGAKRSRKLNKEYRGKNKATDILSFPISKKEGEIFINLDEARRKARLHSRDEKNYLYFLLIHGMVHLKGFAHGSRMESEEKKYRAIWKI